MISRRMKRILVVVAANMMMMGVFTGCGSKESKADADNSVNTVADASADVVENNGEYTLSNFFASKERVWLYANAEAMGGVVDKSGQVDGIFVTYPDGTLIYTYGGEEAELKTIGEYAQMTDEEIIAFVENNISDTRVNNNFATEDMKMQLSEYVKTNKLKYSFNISTDRTGNEVENEQLVYQTYPSIVSYKSSCSGEVIEGAPNAIGYNTYEDMVVSSYTKEDIELASKENIYTYNYGMSAKSFLFSHIDSLEKSVVYDSHYLVIPASDDGYRNFFITRCNENDEFILNYDSIGTEGIVIDKEAGEIFTNETILTEDVDYFWEKTGTVNDYLECNGIAISSLVEQGVLDTLFEGEYIDKEIFEYTAKMQYNLQMLDEQMYNDLIANGYISGSAE